MNNIKKIALFGCLFIFGCEGGFLNQGVGETGNFTSLIERVNSEINSQQIKFIESDQSNYVNFRTFSIVNVDQGVEAGFAQFINSELLINSQFNRTEIIITENQVTGETPDEILETFFTTYIIATKDVFFSERTGPVEELMYAIQISESNYFENGLTIGYRFIDDLLLRNEPDLKLEDSSGLLSFSFTEKVFRLFIVNKSTQPEMEFISSGSIASENYRGNTFD